MSVRTRQFSTGLPFLDRRLNGGIPIGSTVALTAMPSSQSELLLQRVTRGRQLTYLSTLCPDEEELRTSLSAPRRTENEVTVKYVSPDSFLDAPETPLSGLPPESFLVIDPMDILEQGSQAAYLALLNTIVRHARETESVALLHCLDTPSTPPHRPLTLKRVDQVWQLETQAYSQDIKNRLCITKARNSRALTEPIPLVLTDQVRIDTSRNI